MKTKTQFVLFVLIFVIISLSSVTCNITPRSISAQVSSELCQQVEDRPYLALIEGLQPISGDRMKLLGQKISSAQKVCVCATSGNHDAHMPVIRKAHENHQPIYIAGFSMGELEAVSLAEDCGKENIPVERLFLLDGPEKSKINKSVKKVVDIIGVNPYLFRRNNRYLDQDLEDKGTILGYYKLSCGHLNVPANSYPIFSSEISRK